MTATATATRLIEVRCRHCGRLLFKAEERGGRVEIVCPDRRCRRMQTHVLTGRDAR